MNEEFNPVEVWMYYGLSDLYFGWKNQEYSIHRYGTFFYIMAAEKHLKSVLICSNAKEYEGKGSVDEKKLAVEKIAKGYSHNFKKMINDVGSIYYKEMHKRFVDDSHLGFESEIIIKAMVEGYMETRYPSLKTTSRHFPVKSHPNVYHDPLGSSFFTEFVERLCIQCWSCLVKKGLNAAEVLSRVRVRFSNNEDFGRFESLYFERLNV